MLQSMTQSLGQKADIQNYAYRTKSLNNFQNAQASDFKLFQIKVLLFYILAEVSIPGHKQKCFSSFFQEKITF